MWKLGPYAAGLALALYGVVFFCPALLFAHEVRSGNVALRARAALPPEAQQVADEVRRRISLSPLYDRDAEYRVYLCDTPGLFAMFALWNRNVGAIAQPLLTGNVFTRPSKIGRDRLIGPSGNEVEGERTLTYFIAHEIGHVMIGRALGRAAYWRLPVWKDDGYADYVGKAGNFDFEEALGAYRDGEPEMDPARSGLYLRYHLMTALYLDRKGMGVSEFLKADLAPGEAERELYGL